MSQADIPQVMAVERRAYPYPWTEGIFRDCVRVGYSCWVGLDAQALRGYAVMSCAAGEAHLLNLCVDPDFQSRGLGGRLLRHALAQAARLGAECLLLEVRPGNVPARRLYEQLGFRVVGRRKDYYPAEQGREDALVLTRSLTEPFTAWG
ncbi:ribosomal-protein-alanine N-acetyltransferase [Alkalilimnicola sp. S0819]|nr:ribosomal-protein-alanine N-acetyltransferase [Alkalilimnicola sp. S0819]MPQ17307.1 ribosomal-protein-alanine N-acetyltransferase [Alkalilimnicola sp. S0819]